MISSASFTPCTEGNTFANSARRSGLASATALTIQFSAEKKFLTRFGPQYPYPITPTLIVLIFSTGEEIKCFGLFEYPPEGESKKTRSRFSFYRHPAQPCRQ